MPGPPPFRILSWNIGSYYSQGDSLLELLSDLRIDMALIQEHRVSPQARAKVCRDLRAQGWLAFFGPERECGYGEAVLLHSRYSAALLADSSEICSVAVRLADRRMARFASVYAPVSQRGTQQDFFCCLSHSRGIRVCK